MHEQGMWLDMDLPREKEISCLCYMSKLFAQSEITETGGGIRCHDLQHGLHQKMLD